MSISRSKPVTKVLVVDVDKCALTSTSKRPDLLSQTLIDIATANGYAGLYVCTHRSYYRLRSTSFVQEWVDILQHRKNENPAIENNSFFTSSVVENLVKATGLTCLAVSTPDDHVYEGEPGQKCGMAYEKVTKPYEEQLQREKCLEILAEKVEFEFTDLDGEPPKVLPYADNFKYTREKNSQLLQIAFHAQTKFGSNASIEMHFLDDSLEYCLNIINIKSASLPTGLSIKSFEHCEADKIIADICSPIETISWLAPAPASTARIGQRLATPVVRIFVTDYDICAFCDNTKRPDLLSQELIDIAKNNNYAGMYGCTHRPYMGYRGTDFLPASFARLLAYKKTYPDLDPNNVFAINITQNLEMATGLRCLAVSTSDDHAFKGRPEQQCGFSYTNILQVYEKQLKEKNNLAEVAAGKEYVLHDLETPHSYMSLDELDKPEYSKEKNLQLIQVAHHAVSVFGNMIPLEFHFFDDNHNICEAISKMDRALLPCNVTIKSFRHDGRRGFLANINSPVAVVSGFSPSEAFAVKLSRIPVAVEDQLVVVPGPEPKVAEPSDRKGPVCRLS